MTLELFCPIKPTRILQIFGVNGDYYRAHGINIIGHNGIDYSAFHGQEVRSSHDGMAFYEIDSGGGHGVVVRTDQAFEYEGQQCHFKTIYWHLCDPAKEPQFSSPVWRYRQEHGLPMPVKVGDIIGYADSTGFSTGDHLHFGLKPQAINETDGGFYNPAQNAGYLGAIDPTPFLNGQFAADVNSAEAGIAIAKQAVEIASNPQVSPAVASTLLQRVSALLKSIMDSFKGRSTT